MEDHLRGFPLVVKFNRSHKSTLRLKRKKKRKKKREKRKMRIFSIKGKMRLMLLSILAEP